MRKFRTGFSLVRWYPLAEEVGRYDTTPTGPMKIEEIYRLVAQLERQNHLALASDLPRNGIYLFFERGELVRLEGETLDRIVRVGTHRGTGRFPGRIRQHYGNRGSLGGQRNASVFRRHVGGALLQRDNPDDPRTGEWLRQGGSSFIEVEEAVSKTLRENFSFVCFAVEQMSDRLSLERGLIALLALEQLQASSDAWLGRSAAAKEIRQSGLWNTQHTRGDPLTDTEGQHLRELVAATLKRGRVSLEPS